MQLDYNGYDMARTKRVTEAVAELLEQKDYVKSVKIDNIDKISIVFNEYRAVHSENESCYLYINTIEPLKQSPFVDNFDMVQILLMVFNPVKQVNPIYQYTHIKQVITENGLGMNGYSFGTYHFTGDEEVAKKIVNRFDEAINAWVEFVDKSRAEFIERLI